MTSNNFDKAYLQILNSVLHCGTSYWDESKKDFVISDFGHTYRLDLKEGFPLSTLRRIHFKSILGELLWFLAGDTDIRGLWRHGVRIWDDDLYRHVKSRYSSDLDLLEISTKEDFFEHLSGGDAFDYLYNLENMYPKQWRRWTGFGDYIEGTGWDFEEEKLAEGVQATDHYAVEHLRLYEIDQIVQLERSLKTNPNSRRHILMSWNPSDIVNAVLPACHAFAQFYVKNNKLSCRFDCRSNDWILGHPFNVASYALLTHILAARLDYEVGYLIYQGGDVHVYDSHINAPDFEELLDRPMYTLPTLEVSPEVKTAKWEELTPDMFKLINYQAGSKLTFPLKVGL